MWELSSLQAEFRGNEAQNLLDWEIKLVTNFSRLEKLLRVNNDPRVKIKAVTVRHFVETFKKQ